VAKEQCNPTPEQRQAHADNLRATLYALGCYPTDRGEQVTRRRPQAQRAALLEALAGLEAPDLFCLEVLAWTFKETSCTGWQKRRLDWCKAAVAALGPEELGRLVGDIMHDESLGPVFRSNP